MPAPDLFSLPDKQFFTIGEITRYTAVKSHVLRYWEKQVPELSAHIERRGRRRYYPVQSVQLLAQMKELLAQGYTLKGVRAALFRKKTAPKKTGEAVDIQKEIQQIIDLL